MCDKQNTMGDENMKRIRSKEDINRLEAIRTSIKLAYADIAEFKSKIKALKAERKAINDKYPKVVVNGQ